MDKHLDGKSFDNIRARIDELKRLFPEAVKEGRFDPELLIGLLEENDETYGLNEERYDFTWKGKQESLKLAQRRSDGTLRPCFEESRDWDTTQNLYIEGDNLEVMKLLQQGYLRSVKMIYIDPPYNTGNDFVYEDDFSDPIRKYKEATGQEMRANPETAGRYHSNWLSMMYPRLKIAKTLLRDDGVIFISADDNEIHNLRKLCDDVFGEESFVAQLTIINNLKGRNAKKNVATCHEYLLIYGRHDFDANGLPLTEEQRRSYNQTDENGNKYQLRDLRKRGGPDKRSDRPNMYYPIYFNETTGEFSLQEHPDWVEIFPLKGDGEDGRWRWGKAKTKANISILEASYSSNKDRWGIKHRVYLNPALNSYLNDEEEDDASSEVMSKSKSFWEGSEVSTDLALRQLKELFNTAVFDYPKAVGMISKAILLATSPNKNHIVLDFFSGSGATGQSVMAVNSEDAGNRQFVLVQLPEKISENNEVLRHDFSTIADIGKERIRRAGEKVLLEWKERYANQLSFDKSVSALPDTGFRVFKLDSSNLQKWDSSYVHPENGDLFLQRSESGLNNIKPDRRDIDMVYEVFLKYGVPLTEKLATMQISGKTFYVVGDTGYLMICLEQGITVEIIESLIKTHIPGAVVFSGECFADDCELTNAGLVLDKAQIEFRWI